MKTIKLFASAAVILTLLIGCTNEMDEPVMQDGDIRITSLDIRSGGVLTRAADANGYEGMVKTTWAEGDEIALMIGWFDGKARYHYTTETDNGWTILKADGTPVTDGIVFTKHQMNEGIDVRASYSKSGVDAAYNDELLAEKNDGTLIGQVNFRPINDNSAEYTLALGLEHTKSYIVVELTNGITGDDVQGVQVVLCDAAGTTVATPVTMKTTGATAFECFAEAAYIEKFVVSMLGSDGTTYEIDVYPLNGADDKGFAIKANNHYPFNITLKESAQAKAFGKAKGYGVISFMKK